MCSSARHYVDLEHILASVACADSNVRKRCHWCWTSTLPSPSTVVLRTRTLSKGGARSAWLVCTRGWPELCREASSSRMWHVRLSRGCHVIARPLNCSRVAMAGGKVRAVVGAHQQGRGKAPLMCSGEAFAMWLRFSEGWLGISEGWLSISEHG